MTDSAYYLWEPSGAPTKVELSLAAIDKLNAAFRQSGVVVESETVHRALETGGILLGRQLDAGRITVDDFEEIPSEHRRGASFTLSPANRANLAHRVAKLAKQGRTVVGYFRSHTRPGMYLDQDDDLLIRQFFAQPWQVVLLVNSQASPMGGFFVWDEGEMDRRQTALPFPFDSAALVAGGFPIVSAEPVEMQKAVEVPRVQPAATPAPGRDWMNIAAAIGIFAVAAAFIPASVFTATGLVARAHKTPTVKKTAPALAVTARKTEPVPTEPALDTWQPPPEIRRPVTAAPVKPVKWSPPPVKPAVPTPRAPYAASQSVTGPPPPNDQMAMAPPPPVPAPVPAPAPAPALPRPKPALPSARPEIYLEPVRHSMVHNTLGHIPLFSKLERDRYESRDNFVPARPRSEKAPSVPPELSRELLHDQPVDLRIRIAKNGEVAQTEVLTRKADPLFASIAVHAASEWDFEPARLGNKPVQSEMLVHFRFRAPR